MAVVESNQVTKAKIVYQMEDDLGEMKSVSKTISNLNPGAMNDAIHAGLTAMAGLLDTNSYSIWRVDERELISE